MMLRVLDLFSGIGGFSLGLERAGGFKTVAFCEIDPFCRRVLAKHWPDVPCHDDITTREFQEGEADVICGGFPCQDISVAGLRAGLGGERSGLYRHLVQAIRVVRPRFSIVENVAAILSDGLGIVLGDLAEIGYSSEWHCIPAHAVGSPQRRDRIWLVAEPDGEGRKGLKPFSSALKRSIASLAKYRDPFSHAWCALDGRLDHLREHDGLSITLERARIHALGNAVVPQITEAIGRAILSTRLSEDERAAMRRGNE